MSQKIVGMILTAIAIVIFVFFIRFELYFILGVPILLLVVGIIVTLSAVSGEASISTNENIRDNFNNIHQPLETENINKSEESINNHISHDSEEYRKWKEGK